MGMISRLLERIRRRRTAQARWDERWANPAFYATYRIDELAHYSVLAAYARELRPNGALLDVGCGDGIFRTHLAPEAFSAYVGIDFPEAIARAQARADARTSFVAADMREYMPGRKFDTIVFNESLYYVEDPIGELERYGAFLNPDGIFLVSMHRKSKSEAIWKRIGAEFEMIDRITITNKADVSWILGAFKPAR